MKTLAMTDIKTIDCGVEQWQEKIKRQHEAGELVIMVRSNLGELFPLGHLPNDRRPEMADIVTV
jgi:hypothetical protein